MSTITHESARLATPSPSSRVLQATTAPSTDAGVGAGLAVLRVIVGAIFVAHGAQKLFVFGFGGVIGAFESMGVPLAAIAGPTVALVELFGGLALLAGLFTRVAAAGLAAIMLGAALLVHAPAGFFLPNGAEFVLALFGTTVALALAGPGALSVDALVARRRAES